MDLALSTKQIPTPNSFFKSKKKFFLLQKKKKKNQEFKRKTCARLVKLINQFNQKCFMLNSPKEISTLTDLVHPTKQIFTQNIFQLKENISCTFPKNPVFRLPERTIHLAT